MARRRKRQYRRKNGRRGVFIPINSTLALSTLADNAVIKEDVQSSPFTRRLRVISAKISWVLRGGVATEGPINVGLAHSDYTVTEIVEATDTSVISSSEKIANERAGRLVRKVGTFPGLVSNEELRGNGGGEWTRTRLNWVIEEDFDLSYWAQNRSGGALTGSQVLDIDGTLFGYWE